jgi:hypothetical protein
MVYPIPWAEWLMKEVITEVYEKLTLQNFGSISNLTDTRVFDIIRPH